jgi:hypothetical protein
VYGFASLVTAFAGSFTSAERLPLIYFLIAFPILVLGVFAWLVSKHSGKLFAPSDFKDEGNYVRMQMAGREMLERLKAYGEIVDREKEAVLKAEAVRIREEKRAMTEAQQRAVNRLVETQSVKRF